LLGGPIAAQQAKRQAFVEEMSEYSRFLRMLEGQPQEREKFVHVELATTTAPQALVSDSDQLIADELRAFLQNKLPEYMIPTTFVVLDKLPLSANGKVDRKALPEPKSSDVGVPLAYAPPRDGLEGALADIWREVLQIEKISSRENFFDVGGNSLYIVRIHAKIRERLEREIPIVELFKYTTIESLAAYLSQNGSNSTNTQQGFERAQIRRASRSRRRQSSQQTGQADD
jgi:acyl carrier protein